MQTARRAETEVCSRALSDVSQLVTGSGSSLITGWAQHFILRHLNRQRHVPDASTAASSVVCCSAVNCCAENLHSAPSALLA